MPVKLVTTFTEGWKKHNPSDPIFCVDFIDEKTNRVMFTYGAKLDEKAFWEQYFIALEEYDRNKKVHSCKKKEEHKDIHR